MFVEKINKCAFYFRSKIKICINLEDREIRIVIIVKMKKNHLNNEQSSHFHFTFLKKVL